MVYAFVLNLLSKNIKIKICRTIILLVVLYGFEIWSCTLREQHRQRMQQNRVLRKIFWSERDKVMGEWRRLHIEERYDLYSLPNIIQVIKLRRMDGWGMWHIREIGRWIKGCGGETQEKETTWKM